MDGEINIAAHLKAFLTSELPTTPSSSPGKFTGSGEAKREKPSWMSASSDEERLFSRARLEGRGGGAALLGAARFDRTRVGGWKTHQSVERAA